MFTGSHLEENVVLIDAGEHIGNFASYAQRHKSRGIVSCIRL